MQPLVPPDSHHLTAAQGWLELGNHVEANVELEKITTALQKHPEVLEVRWGIGYMMKNWEACFDIASALVELAPELPNGWRHKAASLHYMKRSQEAYDMLSPTLETFPDDWPIHYDMACYASVLHRIDEARTLLEKAFALGDGQGINKCSVGNLTQLEGIKQMALDDPDLEPLWKVIGRAI